MKKGETMSAETRLKISVARKGKCLGNKNGFQKGQSFNRGKKFSEEHRNKLSIAKKGKPSPMLGKKLSNESRQKMSYSKRRFFIKKNPAYIPFSYSNRKKNRRERMKIYGGHHSLHEWYLLKQKHDFTCLSCGLKEPEIKLTRDHIIPILKGGSDDIENIQPLCVSCNSKKSVSTIRY